MWINWSAHDLYNLINYFSFLQNFVKNAERGIAARLKLLDSTEEEQKQLIQKYLESIKRLEEDNNKVYIYIYLRREIKSKECERWNWT